MIRCLQGPKKKKAATVKDKDEDEDDQGHVDFDDEVNSREDFVKHTLGRLMSLPCTLLLHSFLRRSRKCDLNCSVAVCFITEAQAGRGNTKWRLRHLCT